MILNEKVSTSNVNMIESEGYGKNLTKDERRIIGVDSNLISYALSELETRVIVTSEVSKPSAQRHNRKIPDVCKAQGIAVWDPFMFIRRMNFSTKWMSQKEALEGKPV